MVMTKGHIVRDNVLTLISVVVLSWILELCGRLIVARWAWMIVITVAIALAVPAVLAVGKDQSLSTRSWWIWRAVVIVFPVAGPLAWFVIGENPTRSEWMLFPVIGTAILVLVPAIGLSVRDYGWPTQPPYRIEIGDHNYVHPVAADDPTSTDQAYRDLGSIIPLPPLGRFPIVAQQGSGRPTSVYMRWWNGQYYSYSLIGGR
ncbi:hypothetical protein LQL77_23030 [Rhodococcus cerastii]|nr:hypothetical protein [Rhodococcus cerastii]